MTDAATISSAATSTTTFAVERSNGHDGKQPLKLITKIPLGFDRRELRIETGKASRGGIAVDARVVQLSECGRMHTHAYGLGAGGDFSKVIEVRPVRGTEKALLDLHMHGLAKLDEVKGAAMAHYQR